MLSVPSSNGKDINIYIKMEALENSRNAYRVDELTGVLGILRDAEESE